jgi:hypothetical protein
MLAVLLFTQHQISNGVVEIFNEVTAIDTASSSEDEGDPAADGSGGDAHAARRVESVAIEFYEPVPLCIELARNRRRIASERARAALRVEDDPHVP